MYTYIVLFLGFFLTVASARLSFLDGCKDYNKNKNENKDKSKLKSLRGFLYLAIAGAVLSLCTNINSNIEKEKSDKNSAKLNDSLFKMSNALLKNLTGNGNIPVLIIRPDAPGDNYYTVSCWVFNQGDTPLRGITAQVFDPYSNFFCKDTVEFNKNASDHHNFDQTVKLQWSDLNLGYHPPGRLSKAFYVFKIQDIHPHFYFSIVISWENGSYSCTIDGTKKADDYLPNIKLRDAKNYNKEIKNPPFIKVQNMIQ